PAAAADQPGQFPSAGGGAQGTPAVSRLGRVPRGTTFSAGLAAPADGPAAAALVAPAWYTGQCFAGRVGPGNGPGQRGDRRLSARLYPAAETGFRGHPRAVAGSARPGAELLPGL